MKYGIIYIAISPSGKVYIGKTIHTLKGRINEHTKRALNKNSTVYNTKFSRAIRKYGSELEWKIIHDNIPETELNELEIKEISNHNSYISGYNSTLGGEGCSGLKVSDETKKKISDKNKGRKLTFSDEHRRKLSETKRGKNNPNYGKHHSEEHKKKMSDKLSGKNNPNYGKKASEETRKKQSLAHTGKKLSEETKKKISINHARPMKGKKHKKSSRIKMSQNHSGGRPKKKKSK